MITHPIIVNEYDFGVVLLNIYGTIKADNAHNIPAATDTDKLIIVAPIVSLIMLSNLIIFREAYSTGR